MKKRAFIVGEMLFAAILIVFFAIFVIPKASVKIKDRALYNQVRIAQENFAKALEDMAFAGAIGPYYNSSEEFAKELEKYLRISIFCSASNIKDCMGYSEFVTEKGNIYKFDDFKDGSIFMIDDGEEHDLSGDTISFITADKISMVLAYDKKCKDLYAGVYHFETQDNTTEAQCVSVLLDVNGSMPPNKLNKDISVINVDKLVPKKD